MKGIKKIDRQVTTRLAVVGAGEMGRGIAQKFATEGINVDLVDVNKKTLNNSIKIIKQNLKILEEAKYLTKKQSSQVLPRINLVTNLEDISDVDFVIESIPESIELKRSLFKKLDIICSKHTILSSNSSAISISKIGEVTNRPDRVIGCHWVSPPYLIPLVEVIRGQETSDETLNTCIDLLKKAKVVHAVCQKDIPGFIINRMQRVIQNDALDLVERGIASLEDVDNIFWLALGIRFALNGPLKTNDLTVDKTVSLYGCDFMFKETGDPRFKASSLLREKVKNGELGIKTSRGWYDYGKSSFADLKMKRDINLAKLITFMRKEGMLPS